MVKTASTMLPLGTHAPDFSLPNIDGSVVSLNDLVGSEAVLVMFICNHCPFVKHIAGQLADVGNEYQEKGVAVVAINPNDVENYPDDSPNLMKVESSQRGYEFPYLFDADQSVAKAYRAACTPDFFLFDKERKLVYRGQLDASRPGNDVPVTGADLREAMDAVLARKTVTENQIPSIGCNIKWKEGSQPEYFNPTGISG